MTQSGANTRKSVNNHFSLKEVNDLKTDNIQLKLKDKFLYSSDEVAGYAFDIKIDDEIAGECSVLIEKDFSKIAEVGNVGMELTRKFYGMDLPLKIVKATFDIFREYDQKEILITLDEKNDTIEKTCKDLAGEYIDTIKISDSLPLKKRYKIKLS